MYKTAEQLANEVLLKVAGGGARTLKSFRRLAQRMTEGQIAAANDVMEESVGHSLPNPELARQNVFRKLLSGGLLHQPRQVGAQGVLGHRPSVDKERFFTMGGLWEKDNPRLVQHIPTENIRQMRGKFTLDPFAFYNPTGQTGHSALYRGTIPSKIVKHIDPSTVPYTGTKFIPNPYTHIHDNYIRYADAIAAAPLAMRRARMGGPFTPKPSWISDVMKLMKPDATPDIFSDLLRA
jgi:hypothetical protein